MSRTGASFLLLSVLAAVAAWAGGSSAAKERRLAFTMIERGAKHPHLYTAHADGSSLRRLDYLPGDKQTPHWSPDGRRIAFRWSFSELYTPLAVIDADGRNFVNLTRKSGLAGWSPSWAPDGRRLVSAAAPDRKTKPGLYVMGADGSTPKRITSLSREAQYATWSPDGDKIAFTFVVGRGFEIYTVDPDGSRLRRLTWSGDNNWPMWSPNGREIAFSRGNGDEIWVMRRDGTRKRRIPLPADSGVPAAWAPGSLIAFQCPVSRGRIGICGIRPDGTGLRTLLGGREAGFPGWSPA